MLIKSKELILNDVQHYINSLHIKMIFKKLSKNDFNIIFEKLYPNYLKYFSQSMTNGILSKYLDYYKLNSDKMNLLITSYKNVYKQELFDYPKNLTPDLLKLLPKNERIKYAQQIINNCDETYLKIDEWRCYLDCKIIIKLFKEQIHITPDIKLRQKYLVLMIESCGINDDFDTLLDVLKYYNKRHRNELAEVRQNFLISINKHINLDKMNNEHWLEIFEICDIMSLNNEYGNLWQCEKLFLTQIKYYLKNNLSIDKSIQIYIRWANDNRLGGKNRWTIYDDNPQWEKLCLQKFGELIPINLPDFKYISAQFYFSAIASWNKRNPNDLMTTIDYPWMIDEITLIINDKNRGSYYTNNLLNYFKHDPKAVKYFGDKVPTDAEKFELHHLHQLIVENPELVQQNIDKIPEYLLHQSIRRIPDLHKSFHSGLFGRICGLEDAIHKACLDILSSEADDKISYKSTALRLLIHWLNGDEFYEIARNNYPEEKIIETGHKLAEYKLKFQSAIIDLMKIYYNHPETFIALRKFCVGDFLKLTIGPLTSICLKSPLYKSVDFLNSCMDTPVSFRKHIIRLICSISNKEFIYELLQKLWNGEKNPSIRQVLLENIIKLFISEADDKKWTLLKDCIESLTEKDLHSFALLDCSTKIDDNYLGNYIEICWLVLDKFKKNIQPDFIVLKSVITTEIAENINLISIKFIETILNDNLFADQIDISLTDSYSDLAVTYLLNASTDNDYKLRIDFIFGLLKGIFDLSWNQIRFDNREKPYFTARKYIKELLKNLIMKILQDIEKYKTNNFILSYLPMQLTMIIPDAWTCLYDELLLFEILKISAKCICCFNLGENIRNLLDDEIKKHGTYIIPRFAEVLKMFGYMFKHYYSYQVCEGLLAEPVQSNHCALLVLHIISIDDLYKPTYKGLLERVMKIDDHNIKLILNNFIEGK